MLDWNTAHIQLRTLVIFRNLLQDAVLESLCALLAANRAPMAERAEQYCEFVSRLFVQNENLTDYILHRALTDENLYVRKCAKHQPVSKNLAECLQHELQVLQAVAQLTSAEVRAHLVYDGYLPEWQTRPVDFAAEYAARVREIHTYGYGAFAQYHMFMVRNQEIIPVKHPDATRLSDLKGYERQRKMVEDNTLALLQDKPAANVLLYGDAGTGKSSTVKALANAYYKQGLRLIEVPKKQIFAIPDLVEALSENPLHFILFIDDLSFTGEHEDFGALKAILEGSVSAKPANVAIYATSNRRHLIKESFSDRDGDDIHRNETIQEQVSLSGRFGLAVNFFQPDKEQYLHIIEKLAVQYSLTIAGEALLLEAERFALQKGGRSPRAARQFIDGLRRKQG